MNLNKLAILLTWTIASFVSVNAQQSNPTSGDVTVRLAEAIDFATARPLQAIRSQVVSSTNPAIPAGSLAILQVQNRDGSYTLKLLRINAAGQIYKTMSQPGTSVGGPPASGPHASLANGAMVKFTLTQQDGTAGAPIQQSGPSVAKSAPRAATSSAPQFVIEGIGIGMTRQQVEDAAKAHGGTKGLHDTGNGYPELNTSDLHFISVQFDDSGLVSSYVVTALNPKHLKVGNTSGMLYDMAVTSFGTPVRDGVNSKWNFDKPGQPNAEYSYDKGEAPNGELVVLSGHN